MSDWPGIRTHTFTVYVLQDKPGIPQGVRGGLTPCRQLRPSSRREHVNASSNHRLFIKTRTAQLLSRNLKSLLA